MSRRRALMAESNNRYRRVQFVQATGTQYVPIGLSLTDAELLNTAVTVQAIAPAAAPSSTSFLCSFNYWAGYWIGRATSGDMTLGGNQNLPSINPASSAYTYSITWITGPNRLMLQCGNKSVTRGMDTESGTTKSFTIFGSHSGSYKSSFSLYDLSITKNSVEIMHLVPAVRNSDNVAGLLDLVGNTFYEPTGGALVAGPDV